MVDLSASTAPRDFRRDRRAGLDSRRIPQPLLQVRRDRRRRSGAMCGLRRRSSLPGWNSRGTWPRRVRDVTSIWLGWYRDESAASAAASRRRRRGRLRTPTGGASSTAHDRCDVGPCAESSVYYGVLGVAAMVAVEVNPDTAASVARLTTCPSPLRPTSHGLRAPSAALKPGTHRSLHDAVIAYAIAAVVSLLPPYSFC